jgi:hypothetical protein
MIDPQSLQQSQEVISVLKAMDKQTLWLIFIGGGGIGYLLLKQTLNFLLRWKGKKANGNGQPDLKGGIPCYKQPYVVLAMDKIKTVEEDTQEIKTVQIQLANTAKEISETMKAQQSTFAEVVSLTKIFLDIKRNGH